MTGMNPRSLQLSVGLLLAAAGLATVALLRLFGEGSYFDGFSFGGGLSESLSWVLAFEALVAAFAGFALLHRQRWVLKLLTAAGALAGLALVRGIVLVPLLLTRWSPTPFALLSAFLVVPALCLAAAVLSWKNEALVHPA